MQKLKELIRKGLLYTFATMLITSYPMTAMAEDTPAPEAPPKNTYTYNGDTGRWDSNKWQYDPASGQYQSSRPAPAASEAAPTVPASEQSAADTGPDSTNTQTSNTTKSSDTQATTNATIDNGLTSTATSGNATVGSNMTAGSASSGDASADATIVNTIHSSVQGDTAGVAHFVSDIYGNVSGDITLSPATAAAAKSSTTDSTVQTSTNAEINNNLSLNATSGNADVTKNTKAGDATSGNANTVVNLVNLINSIIAANQSFIGTINIHGNLNGDILVSPDFIPQLIASNVPNVASPLTNSLSANINDSQSIINNISLNAASGKANIDHNTSAGSATTGTAATNLTVLNLTGHQVVAKNSLLVFVNVLGTWVGIIVDAPTGATAAALGSGMTTNTTGGSTNQTINSDNKSTITNNLTLNSKSGDASVTDNTTAGNATSGNATASANVLNMTTSSFSVSDWFGILFINVFGSWYGSFGVNTANGEVVPLDGMALPPPSPSGSVPPAFTFGFVPHASSNNSLDQSLAFLSSQQNNDNSGETILASANFDSGNSSLTTLTPAPTPERNLFSSLTTTALGLFLTTAGVLIEIIRRRRITTALASL